MRHETVPLLSLFAVLGMCENSPRVLLLQWVLYDSVVPELANMYVNPTHTVRLHCPTHQPETFGDLPGMRT